jgi:predicted AlkP superfamily phosphohydrolase/phosphomutase
MRRRLLLFLLAASAALSATDATGQAPARRVVFISFDAAADWIVDRLIAKGKAPAFAALAREGAQADAMISVIPSLTAVAHASLWTGAFPRAHGATDNYMPRTPPAGHTLLERQSGYLSTVLRAEPIWDTAARQGKRVLVPQASSGFPFTNRYPALTRMFDIYANELLASSVVTGSLGGTGLAFSIAETTASLTRKDGEALMLTVGSTSVSLSPGSGALSPPMPVRVNGVEGLVRICLLEYDQATGRVLAVRGDVVRLMASDEPSRDGLLAEAGVTLGEVASGQYQSGRYGPTLADGGDGSAERHLVTTTLANQQYFDGTLRYAARQPWDLLVLYVPTLDIAGHALAGMLDPDTPGHDPILAEKIWPYYEEMFARGADAYVAAIRRLAPDAALVIGADHGVEGNRRMWYPNAVLREAGLLVETANGAADLSRTRAIFLHGHGGGVYVNSTRYKSGIVPESQRAEVKRLARNALLAARDPETDTPLVRAVVDTDLDGEALGIGGEVAADLYPDPTPGYMAGAFTGQRIVGPPRAMGWGAHGPFPTRRRLHGIFYAAGPGVRAGARPGIVRQVDAAPTVARLLGIDPPLNSVGRALPIE